MSKSVHFLLTIYNEEMLKSKQMRLHNVFWKDSSKRIILSDCEIKNFKNQLNKDNEDFKLVQNNITAENCIIVNNFFPHNMYNFSITISK